MDERGRMQMCKWLPPCNQQQRLKEWLSAPMIRLSQALPLPEYDAHRPKSPRNRVGLTWRVADRTRCSPGRSMDPQRMLMYSRPVTDPHRKGSSEQF